MNKMKRSLQGMAIVMVTAVLVIGLSAQEISSPTAKHKLYKVVVLPPDGGPDSFLAGYLIYAPMNERGTLGVATDTATPGFNSYTWNNGKQTDFQALPQLSNLTGTATYINWINEWGLAAGYGTRTDSTTGASLDNAVVWAPNGQIFPLSTPQGDQSHAVSINDFAQASGWIENSVSTPCSFGTGGQTAGVVWQFGILRRLGTLGGTQSYGEFTNDLGQVSGHSETSTAANTTTNCPPYDPFIWQNGKMTDINPGNFGGAEGGTNFLSNHGHAVGFGTLPGEVVAHAFLWQKGTLTDLDTVGTLGGSLNSAYNVNEQGHVVGASSVPDDSVYHSVLWRNGEFTDLGTVSGDCFSQPTRINSSDQIVGASFSCDFSTLHAFLWENGELQDLNSLIPADSGLELQSASWITDDGVIAAQAVLTEGDNAGASRAVLLIPTGECSGDVQVSSSATIKKTTALPQSSDATIAALKGPAIVKTEDGRLNRMLLRPFSPVKLQSKKQN